MPLLKHEPPAPVRSLPELFAVAYAMEEEAAARYRELAAAMRAHGAAETAEVFAHLAEEERGEQDQVVRWSTQMRGLPASAADIRWRVPDNFDEEAGDIAGSHVATPYRALSMAVRNKERVFAFWTYIAAHASAAEIHRTAEAMAREALEHVALLRRERRRAFHAARGKESPRPRAVTAALAEATALERGLSHALDRLQAGDAETQARLRAWARESLRMADAIGGDAPAPAAAEPAPAAGLHAALATAERLVERYLEIAEHAPDEATLGRAQMLASRAVARLAVLRDLDFAAARRRQATPPA